MTREIQKCECGATDFQFVHLETEAIVECVSCGQEYRQYHPDFMYDMIEFMKCSRDEYQICLGYSPSKELIELRKELIEEEVIRELFFDLDRLKNEPLTEAQYIEIMSRIMDHIVDSVYVLIGTAVAFDLPFNEHWKEVHKKNMEKFPIIPSEGAVRHPEVDKCEASMEKIIDFPKRCRIVRNDGKILKPVGWTPPDALAILKKHWGIQDA